MNPFPTLRRLVVVAALLTLAAPAHAQLSLPWWAIPGGGTSAATSGSYRLSAAAGLADAAVLSGGMYKLSGGFWSMPPGSGVTDAPAGGAPVAFAVAPLSPNPFTRATALEFALPARGRVTAEVFDVRGERVRTLLDEVREPGAYREPWDGANSLGQALRAGVYFVRVRAAGHEATRRVVRLE